MTKGIILVSHVEEIAQGLAKLIKEVAADVPLTIAGGTEDGGIGTSFEKISAAFEANSSSELVAFYDLGSAKMNLEMAMEMTEKEVILLDVALIEGAYTAAALLQVDTPWKEIASQLEKLKIK
ncbi:PTS hybrid protein [Enterococcus sp. PF1-24]|uniref:dihydroxyacetone kinase phosphoryl donor subunit DhaM n=1 Tax=unclassified Enterococcus TaxID=2608891 RepID=UPI0024758999|nr:MULTISPECIES: dihydroxyacetone kinase phosphoryl donor subunit DhaM [unclassified Enterococcus]MDH6365345.1 PTS hybrid protein [Enterococcus sp. PFB1-1]MDH6402446.1 PTS hybrid protein [Enterococcus sp. PF1-24]